MKRRALAFALLGSSCLTLDPFLFTPEQVDEYDWDADPCDPQLAGEIAEAEVELLGEGEVGCHPSRIDADHRVEDFVELADREVHYVFALQDEPAPTLVFSHGRAKHLGRYWDRVELWWEQGFNVLVYDYPKYGRSTGDELNEDTMAANGVAVLPVLEEQGVDLDRVFLFGYSLGSAPAFRLAQLADEGEVMPFAGLVVDAPICSAQTLVETGAFVDFPASFFAENELDNCAIISSLDADFPILIMHGAEDSFVLPIHSERLMDEAAGSPELHMVAGADHTQVVVAARGDYESWVRSFAGL